MHRVWRCVCFKKEHKQFDILDICALPLGTKHLKAFNSRRTSNNNLSLTFYPEFVTSAVFVDKDENSNEEHATESSQKHGDRHLQKKAGSMIQLDLFKYIRKEIKLDLKGQYTQKNIHYHQ